jgi:hypothetical protein
MYSECVDNYKKIVGVLLFISLVGLFLPWFFFDKNVDYKLKIPDYLSA